MEKCAQPKFPQSIIRNARDNGTQFAHQYLNIAHLEICYECAFSQPERRLRKSFWS